MDIYINGELMLSKKKINNIFYYKTKNQLLKTKDIFYFTIYCSKCNREVKLKIFPTKLVDYHCKSCRNTGENNPMYGKKWTNEQKMKKSKSMIGENNHMYNKTTYDVWLDKYGKDIADQKWNLFLKKMSSTSEGKNNPMYGKTVYSIWVDKYGKDIADEKQLLSNKKKSDYLKNNPEHHKNMILQSHRKMYKKTSIERKVENYLLENKINFKYNFIDKYQYDFLLKDMNIIIEVQGDYWHGNPLYYPTDKLNKTQLYKQKLDKEKLEYIKDRYNIIYLWETDIKNNNYKETLWNLLKLKK